MEENPAYEMIDSKCYSMQGKETATIQCTTHQNHAVSKANSMPANYWFRVTVVLLILLSFLLVAGIGALSYFQAKMVSEVHQGFTGGLSVKNISGFPAPSAAQGSRFCNIIASYIARTLC